MNNIHKIGVGAALLLFLTIIPSSVGAQVISGYDQFGNPIYQTTNTNFQTNFQQQIAAIQAQLQQLIAQRDALIAQQGNQTVINTTGVIGSTQACNFTRRLVPGSVHSEVATLKQVLSQLGIAGAVADGSNVYNSNLQVAVNNFQSQFAGEILHPIGLTSPTSVVGVMTRQKLNQICNNASGSVLGVSTYVPPVIYTPPVYVPPVYTPPVYYPPVTNNPGYIQAPTLNFVVTPTTVAFGDQVTIFWNTTNVSSCRASGGFTGELEPNGSRVFTNMQYRTTYNIECFGHNGEVRNASATVYVSGTSAETPTITLTASPTRVNQNGTVFLSWSTTNAANCVASGDWTGSKNTSGSESRSQISDARTYVLTCTNTNGDVTETSTSVSVNGVGTSGIIPTVSLFSSPNSVIKGNSATLSWSSSNAAHCIAEGDWTGTKTFSGSETVTNISNPRTYILTCIESTGNATQVSATINVTN